jgi:hypothetical protein
MADAIRPNILAHVLRVPMVSDIKQSSEQVSRGMHSCRILHVLHASSKASWRCCAATVYTSLQHQLHLHAADMHSFRMNTSCLKLHVRVKPRLPV